MTQWYVQDRTSLSGYANVKSDAASIEAIGTVFPMVFFVVAILISLTTITRMVEEDRGLIGTYKALGFTDREIRRKYLVYACAASVSGGILGNVCGFVLLPEIISGFLIRCICSRNICCALCRCSDVAELHFLRPELSSLPPVHVKRNLYTCRQF